MILASNLKTVIGNLERLQTGLTTRVGPAVRTRWEPVLLTHARTTLQGLVNSAPAGNAGRTALLAHVDHVLGTFTTEGTTPEAAHFRMRFEAPAGARVDFTGLTPPPVGRPPTVADPTRVANDEAWRDLRDAILDWVDLEKDWTMADGPKAEDAVRDKAAWLLDLLTTTRPLSLAEAQARDAFLHPAARGHGLYEALTRGQEAGGESPLDPAVARQWAQAVLHVWRALLLAELPGRVRAELRKLVRELQTTMI